MTTLTRRQGRRGQLLAFTLITLLATITLPASTPAVAVRAVAGKPDRSAQAATRRFSLDDFSRVARVSEPQISPDGKSVAVVISHANLDENRYEPDLVLVDVASGTVKSSFTAGTGIETLAFY